MAWNIKTPLQHVTVVCFTKIWKMVILLWQYTYVCFAIQIRKLLMKGAVEQRVNVAASRHVMGTWLVVWVSQNIQASGMFVVNLLRRFLISVQVISMHITDHGIWDAINKMERYKQEADKNFPVSLSKRVFVTFSVDKRKHWKKAWH